VLSSIDNMTVKPLRKDGKLFNIELIYNNIKLSLRDSLLMLPNSLKLISKAFDIEGAKRGIYPYDLANSANLNYIGKVPKFKYFNLIHKEYSIYTKSRSNIK
jgi:hypothetical protein